MRIFKRGDKPATVTENASVLGDSFFDHLLRQQQSRKSDLRNPFTGDPFDPSERYLSARSAALARAMRCPVRVHVGSDCAEPPQACQVGRLATTDRPFVRCLSVASVSKVERKSPAQSSGWQRTASTNGISRPSPSVCRLLQKNLPRTDMASYLITFSVAARRGLRHGL